ncbi:hypothetical protein [Profundibacter sp.]
MNRQLVLYLDNCVFSELLKPDSAGLRKNFAALPHRLAFSDIHIVEMRNNHHEYTALLKELDAVFIRNPGAIHGRYHPISSLDSADPELRFSEYFQSAPALEAFEEMLPPLHHLLGGARR